MGAGVSQPGRFSDKLGEEYVFKLLFEFFTCGESVGWIFEKAEDGGAAAAHLSEAGIVKSHYTFDFNALGHLDNLLEDIARVGADSVKIPRFAAFEYFTVIGVIEIGAVRLGISGGG